MSVGVALLSATLLCDLSLLLAGLQTELFQPNNQSVFLVYVRTLLGVLLLTFLLFFTISREGVSLICVTPSWEGYDDRTRFFMKTIFAG